MDLTALEGCCAGQTAWVFGSGATMNHLDPRFFADKLTISTNLGAVEFGVRPDFAFTHYHHVAQQLLTLGCPVVTLACDTRSQQPWVGPRPRHLVLVEHPSYVGPSDRFDPFVAHRPAEGTLVYGSSSLHGAMHLAAYVGAAHLVLVGADCGRLDGEPSLTGHETGDVAQDRILALYDRDHRQMKAWLAEQYGVTVYSLNPFINPNLEGHRFSGPHG